MFVLCGLDDVQYDSSIIKIDAETATKKIQVVQTAGGKTKALTPIHGKIAAIAWGDGAWANRICGTSHGVYLVGYCAQDFLQGVKEIIHSGKIFASHGDTVNLHCL